MRPIPGKRSKFKKTRREVRFGPSTAEADLTGKQQGFDIQQICQIVLTAFCMHTALTHGAHRPRFCVSFCARVS